MMRIPVAAALLVVLSACGSFDPADGLVIEPDASVYRPGGEYDVEVRNATRDIVRLGICPSLFRQTAFGGEEPVLPALPCPAVVHELMPGASMAMTGVIPADAEGEYRVGVAFWTDPYHETRADARSRVIRVED